MHYGIVMILAESLRERQCLGPVIAGTEGCSCPPTPTPSLMADALFVCSCLFVCNFILLEAQYLGEKDVSSMGGGQSQRITKGKRQHVGES